jgi:hypothetical protein
MDELISKYFYEVMPRIAPGLLIIVLYWRIEAENLFHTHRDLFKSPSVFIVCILAAAWLIGWMLEGTISITYKFISGEIPRRKEQNNQEALRWENEDLNLENNRLRRENENLKSQMHGRPPETKFKDEDRETWRGEVFFGAISVMCRNLMFVALYSLLAVTFFDLGTCLSDWLPPSLYILPVTWLHIIGLIWRKPETTIGAWNATCSIAAVVGLSLAWRHLKQDIAEKERKAKWKGSQSRA